MKPVCSRTDCDNPAMWTIQPVVQTMTGDWEYRTTGPASPRAASCHRHLPDVLNWMSEYEADFHVHAIDGPGWKQ